MDTAAAAVKAQNAETTDSVLTRIAGSPMVSRGNGFLSQDFPDRCVYSDHGRFLRRLARAR
jgi:hypothetical protein